MTPVSNNITDSCGTSIILEDEEIEHLLEKEWLLTNSRGGFACGTLAGCNTRRYHGHLIGTLTPPANRILALSQCLETVTIKGEKVELTTCEFDNVIQPKGYRYLTEFKKDIGVHFVYKLGPVNITKSIYLAPDTDAVAVVYQFHKVYEEFDFSVRPFAAMRDFHSLQKSISGLCSLWRGDGLTIRTDSTRIGELFLRSDQMWFQNDPQWWYNFFYRVEKQRGQDCFEDLWSPGVFNCHVNSPMRIVLWAGLLPFMHDKEKSADFDLDIDIILDSLMLREKELIPESKVVDNTLASFCSAAGTFVIERRIEGKLTPTILAGYPWFLDWGRDTFISLPGLLLCTGRYKTAAGVLTTFADAVSEGMIPNRFDDYGQSPHYNSVDASLWFIHSAFEYLDNTSDVSTFSVKLLPAVKWIIDSYHKGTRFGIHADTDQLITAGTEDTQLTWMDAKCGGIAFTPRYGKAVEVNALWYSNLQRLADYYENKDSEQHSYYKKLTERVKESFNLLFWNDMTGYLNDCILSKDKPDTTLRPNQIFAVSLPYSALNMERQEKVIDIVAEKLLTPYGLRSLNPDDSRYIGTYTNDQFQRDSAYHNGTVWAFLIGPFVEAYLKVNDFSRKSKVEAAGFLEPLLNHMTDAGCIGNVSEIFDGAPPHKPRGCFAQAWSIAELLRAYMLIQ